jgi:acyl-CoA thioesterase FadM
MRKNMTFSVSKNKLNVSGRIDPVLYKYIDAICHVEGIKKVDVFEEALWDFVEKRGFPRDQQSEDHIEITRKIPGKYDGAL